MRSVICEYCDAVYQRVPLTRRAIARCDACDAVLYHPRANRIDAMLALSLAAVVAFVVAMTTPLIALTVNGVGTELQPTLWDAVSTSYDSGVTTVAVIAVSSLFLFPLIEIVLYLWILLPMRGGRVPIKFRAAMHMLRLLRPWSMVEVFMLGVVVAVVKLTALGAVRPAPGIFGFAALTVILVTLASFDRRELWSRADEMTT